MADESIIAKQPPDLREMTVMQLKRAQDGIVYWQHETERLTELLELIDNNPHVKRAVELLKLPKMDVSNANKETR